MESPVRIACPSSVNPKTKTKASNEREIKANATPRRQDPALGANRQAGDRKRKEREKTGGAQRKSKGSPPASGSAVETAERSLRRWATVAGPPKPGGRISSFPSLPLPFLSCPVLFPTVDPDPASRPVQSTSTDPVGSVRCMHACSRLRTCSTRTVLYCCTANECRPIPRTTRYPQIATPRWRVRGAPPPPQDTPDRSRHDALFWKVHKVQRSMMRRSGV